MTKTEKISVVIILAVIVLCAFKYPVVKKVEGQEKPDTISAWWYPTPEQFLNKVEVDYSAEYIVIGLLKTYREYSAGCYKDSMLIVTHPTYMDSSGWVYPVFITKREWIHREPTFPGFMAWLEEKYAVKTTEGK